MVPRPRVLLAIAPVAYESALSYLLERADVDDVVPSFAALGGVAGEYDVAVVTGEVPPGVVARVVIHLPATPSGTGKMRVVESGAECRKVSMGGPMDLFAAIDSVLPSTRRRAEILLI